MSTPQSVSNRRRRSEPYSGRTGRSGRAHARWDIGVRSCGAESMLVLACTLSKRMGFLKCVFVFLYAGFSSLTIRVWSDRVMACGRLERLWGVGRSSAIMLSRVGHHTVSRSVELGTSTPPYLLQYAATARLAPSRSIIDSILRVFYSASSTER